MVQLLLPLIEQQQIIKKTGDLITLPYTETTLIDQPFASKSVNVNPFEIFTWSGNIELTPPTDEWKETNRAPELVINQTGGFDTLVSGLGNASLQGIEIGTVWNDWQDFWSGTPTDVSSRDVSVRYDRVEESLEELKLLQNKLLLKQDQE